MLAYQAARLVATVVLPEPPFGLRMMILCIGILRVRLEVGMREEKACRQQQQAGKDRVAQQAGTGVAGYRLCFAGKAFGHVTSAWFESGTVLIGASGYVSAAGEQYVTPRVFPGVAVDGTARAAANTVLISNLIYTP